MLKQKFDPKQPHRAVEYLRMSDEMQNARSPEQQAREIRLTLKRTGYNFTLEKTYQDSAKSGRFIRKRPGYLQMVRDIKTGVIQPDLILVDTIERFGRVDELDAIRKDLFENYGVLVLAADSNFCDPLSPQGRALAMVENLRASEDGRIKAHNVVRGKRDAAIHKQWPGGPAPFGYRLKSIIRMVNGREEVDHCVLVPEPRAALVMQMLFTKAAESGWGATRLARWLNERDDVPEDFKPFRAPTIGRQLDNRIYYGELIWNTHCTGIVADIRVLQPNPEMEWERVADFCEPLVTKDLWEKVQKLRDYRRAESAPTSSPDANGKQIQPSAPGMTLNYLLSGLLFCSECGIRMTVSSTQAYTTKSGDRRSYASYRCPGYASGSCDNDVAVPEEWLRNEVVNVMRRRLFPWDRPESCE